MRWLKLPLKSVLRPHPHAGVRNSLALSHYELKWTAREASQLFEATGRARVYAELPLPGGRTCFQSTILDFDLTENCLTIEPFFPRVELLELYRLGPFELRLEQLQPPLELLCLAVDQVGGNHGQVHLKVLEKKAMDARGDPRGVVFSTSSAPAIELFMPLCGVAKGSVTRISEHKLTLALLELPIVPARTTLGTCTIRFTEQFQLHASLRIKAVRRERKPHRHYIIQADFDNNDATLTEKLRTFLAMVDPTTPDLAPEEAVLSL